ncbi:MAG: hypothetical protein AB1664_22250 [Thermodesulfobacteriota bacterium]
MRPYFEFNEKDPVFSIVEETEFFRLKMDGAEIREEDVEDFLDTTVEWFSSNPTKGILIDFKGVKVVCGEFAEHLRRYYVDLKARGLPVRFVNVDPNLKRDVDVTNITVVLSLSDLNKPAVSAKQIIKDLAEGLNDSQLMAKHGLSDKGLESMFRKLVARGVISEAYLARRQEKLSQPTIEVDAAEGSARKVTVDAMEVLVDIAEGLSNEELMDKFRLSPKGLRSLLRKLYAKRFIDHKTFAQRRRKTKA